MTIADAGAAGPPRDDPLNAQRIEAKPGGTPKIPPAARPEGRYKELTWALCGGLGPVIIAVILQGAITGWSVDPANLGYCLFALSLAAIVRIVSHGSGKEMLPVLLLCGIVQIVFALYFSGTFDTTSTPSKSYIVSMEKSIEGATSLGTQEVHSISGLLTTIATNDHPPSGVAYISFAVTGIIVMAILLRYWSPAISEQAEQS